MPKAGDKFNTHIYSSWGEYNPKRQSHSRSAVAEEAYIVIPQLVARNLEIFMSNNPDANTEYDAFDDDGNFICILKSQGNVAKGSTFAKQFAGSGDLKALSDWISNNSISDSDTIEVLFTSNRAMKIRKV